MRFVGSSAAWGWRNPITGIAGCCARASTDRDLEPAFASFSQRHVGAVFVGSGNVFNTHMEQLAALAARHALPTIHTNREYVVAGGLMSYGSSSANVWHQAGIYTGRILKGEKPADLPVEQAVRIELTSTSKRRRRSGSNFRPACWSAPTK